jgi:hypothetical protein
VSQSIIWQAFLVEVEALLAAGQQFFKQDGGLAQLECSITQGNRSPVLPRAAKRATRERSVTVSFGVSAPRERRKAQSAQRGNRAKVNLKRR